MSLFSTSLNSDVADSGAREEPEPTESELAQAAAAGDRLAQRELFHQLKPRVHATLYRVLGSNAHTEDLLQEAFVEIFKSLTSYRGESRLSTWADRIAVRVVYRHFARERRRPKPATWASPELCLVGSAEDDVMLREAVRRLYRALDALKPSHRVAFALFAVDGRSLKEVATITGASLVATKSRVWRARRELATAAKADAILARYLSTATS